MSTPSAVPDEQIEKCIYFVRGHKVMLDSDLSVLYQVQVKRLNEAIRRNRDRFPEDFMFQLTEDEVKNLGFQIGASTWASNLRTQSATSSWGGRRYRPYDFSEQGVAMLSSVLHSKRAVRVNIEIMRAFVRLRKILTTHKDLAQKLQELEKKYDAQFRVVFEAIRRLMSQPSESPLPPESKSPPIGFGKQQS